MSNQGIVLVTKKQAKAMTRPVSNQKNKIESHEHKTNIINQSEISIKKQQAKNVN